MWPERTDLRHKLVNWNLCKPMKLAYRFLVFCRDFFTWKVVKIKGRGGRRHISGVVVCGSLKA
jgi:hypothetical protein